MSTTRSYEDPCGIARSLDAVGERWALLVVRELMFGPKRFQQLRSGLHGISPNVLSQRLRDLEGAGVLRRSQMEPPASVEIYELTPRGQALKPILLELGRWGSHVPITTSEQLSLSGFLLALETLFEPAAAVDATFALRVDNLWVSVTVDGGHLGIARGPTERPTVAFDTDLATIRSIAFGRETLARAEHDGRLKISGSRRAASRFTRMFPLPVNPSVR